MKSSFLILSLLLSFSAFSKDMSRTETYDEAYKETEDGFTEYVGKCSVHQGYADKNFTVGNMLLDTVEPMGLSDAEYQKAIKNVDKSLLAAFEELGGWESMKDTDDFTIEKIQSTQIVGLDLYRANVGVGGGNGIFIVINKIKSEGKPTYELMSNIMDGDVEFCDSKVWLK
jgi:hypothetical protein